MRVATAPVTQLVRRVPPRQPLLSTASMPALPRITPPPAAPERVSLPLPGTIFAHGGGALPVSTMKRFADLCHRGKLVLIPTANPAAERERYRRRIVPPWARLGFRGVSVLHASSRAEANRDAFITLLRDASCVWLGGGVQGRLIRRYVGTRIEAELHALLRRGGTIGGYSAGTAIMTDIMIRHGNPRPYEGRGFGILPRVIVDQHFVAHDRERRLLAMLERHPELVGYGVDENAALVVSGDRFRVVGNSVVRRCTHGVGCVDLLPGAAGEFPGDG